MPSINRSSLVVRLKEPYVTWANSLPGKHPTVSLDKLNVMPSVYLVDPDDGDFDGSKAIRKYWRPIFERELDGWSTEPAEWPQHRTIGLFREWFEVSFGPVVVDLSDEPVEVDE